MGGAFGLLLFWEILMIITGIVFLDRLSERVEDPSTTGVDGNNYSRQQLIDVSNFAQEALINLIDYEYLSALEAIDTGVLVTNGVCHFSTGAGIKSKQRRIKYKVDGGKWCEKITMDAVHNLDNAYTVGTLEYPIVWEFDEESHFSPPSITAVDIYYIKTPTAITDTSTAVEFQYELIEPILLLAEAEIWKQDNKNTRAELAYTKAVDQINFLNQRIK